MLLKNRALFWLSTLVSPPCRIKDVFIKKVYQSSGYSLEAAKRLKVFKSPCLTSFGRRVREHGVLSQDFVRCFTSTKWTAPVRRGFEHYMFGTPFAAIAQGLQIPCASFHSAEEKGFEPLIGFPRCRFSRPVPSTTQPLFQVIKLSLYASIFQHFSVV